MGMTPLQTLPLARGDVLFATRSDIHSPLQGVSNEAWTRFVTALETQTLSTISSSNALGAYEMRPRRLQDLKMMTNLHVIRKPVPGSDTPRQIWEGDFIPPYTLKKFLSDPVLQYTTLVKSVLEHDKELAKRTYPSEITRSGALALLHRGGWSMFDSWSNPKKRFSSTNYLFLKTNGVF